jgi:hypothetical protein
MTYGTATAAKQFWAIALLQIAPTATQSALDRVFDAYRAPAAVYRRSPTQAGQPTSNKDSVAPDLLPVLDVTRATTPKEQLIGELRGWRQLSSRWDGEDAEAPEPQSIDDAVKFARMLGSQADAQPMLHVNGHAGLFWRDDDLYADIEFLGSGRIAYFIEKNGDKHKGMVNFVAKEMPNLFKALLPV